MAVIAALLSIQILFGVNYIVTKSIIGALPPLVWGSVRIMISAVVLVGLALATRRKHPPFSFNFFGPLFLFAIFGIILNQSAFLVGLKHTTSTNSAVLNTMIPVFTLGIVTLRGFEPLTFKRCIGFALALSGVLVLRRIENFTFSDKTLLGDFLTMINGLSFSIFLAFSKEFTEIFDPIWTTAWLFIYGSVGLSLLAFPDYRAFHGPIFSHELMWQMLYGIIGGTLLPYLLNVWALARTHSSSVALFIYIQPVITTGISWLWLHEQVTMRVVSSTLLIFFGMILALAGKPRKADPVAEPGK